MVRLLTHIRTLAGIREYARPLRGPELAELPQLADAWLLVENDTIAGFGRMDQLPVSLRKGTVSQDCSGRIVLPAWCDSHTHLVFARSREEEYVHKLRGLSYAEIAARGGGILHSARALEAMPEDELFIRSWERLQEAMRLGTGAIEIKSGYGLSTAAELKMLRVIRRLREKSPLHIKATFLGAHALPEAYRNDREGYLRLLETEMLPRVAAEKLADFMDVFCEQGFFTPAETDRICRAGLAYGLRPKLHVNQLSSSGGLQQALAIGALSADHLEIMTDTDIRELAASATIGPLLPTAAFFLQLPFPPARRLIEAGAAIAIASDFNPGSSPSCNMNLVVAMACMGMRLLPGEAIQAATINGAAAMELEQVTGSIRVGQRADFILTRPVPSLAYLPYAFGNNHIEQVFLAGEPVS